MSIAFGYISEEEERERREKIAQDAKRNKSNAPSPSRQNFPALRAAAEEQERARQIAINKALNNMPSNNKPAYQPISEKRRPLWLFVGACIAIPIAIVVLLCVFLRNEILKERATQERATQEITTTSRGTPIDYDFDISVSMIGTPSSSCFKLTGWDSSTETLVVTFRDSGDSYAYDGVPRRVWDSLRAAKSQGGYYNDYIKGQYECTKIG